MQTHSEEILTQNDFTSINAMVEQLAIQKKFNRENIYFLLEKEFSVTSVNHIKRRDFDRAIALLVDLQNLSVH